MLLGQSSKSRGSHLSVLAFTILVITPLAVWLSWSPVDADAFVVVSQKNVVEDMSDSVLSALKVSVRQANTSPPKLALGVTNTHSSAVTVFTWNSPLDPLALQLGLLSFTAEGTDTPIDIPRIQVKRMMPPPADDFVTIEPGQTKERDVLLKRPLVPLEQLHGKVEVVCKGEWMAVWEFKKEDISAESLRDAQVDKTALRGGFESEPVVVEF